MEGEGRRGAEGEPGGGADGDRGGYEVVLRQAALVEDLQGRRAREAEAGRRRRWRDEQLEQEGGAEIGWGLLGDAYDRCGEVCAEYAKTFYLGEVQDCLSVTEDEYSHLGC